MSTERFVIVAAIDDTPMAFDVVNAAAGFARAIAGAEIHFLNVVEDLRQSTRDEPRSAARRAKRSTKHASGCRTRRRGRAACAQRESTGTWPWATHGARSSRWRRRCKPTSSSSARTAAKAWRASSSVRSLRRWRGRLHARSSSCGRRTTPNSLCPRIEPPCPDCLATQRETKGERLWCDRHEEHHPRAHTYSEMPPSFGEGSSLIR